MSISENDIKHLAELARIHLTGEELALFQRELPSILDFVAALQSADISGADAAAEGAGAANVMRKDDEAVAALGDTADLKSAFLKTDARGALLVPKILDYEA